jgi:hypothetical protein
MQDGSWGHTFMIFVTMTFRHVIAVDRVWEYKFIESVVWMLYYPKSSGYVFSFTHKFLLMGVKCRVHYPVFITDDEVEFLLLHNSWVFKSSGVRPALLMRLAPEAIVEFYLFEYRLHVSLSLITVVFLHRKFPHCEFSYRVRDQRSWWE